MSHSDKFLSVSVRSDFGQQTLPPIKFIKSVLIEDQSDELPEHVSENTSVHEVGDLWISVKSAFRDEFLIS